MAITFVVDDTAEKNLKRACYRLALGCFTSFVARITKVGNGHILDGIILSTIIHLNVVDALDDTGARRSLTSEPLADELRRPVSVYMLARRLSLPYETVRRHVARIVEQGYCVRVGREGVVVNLAVITGLMEREAVSGLLQDLGDLVAQMDAIGALKQTVERGDPAASRDWIG